MLTNVLIAIAAYLLGSIPSAVWIGRSLYGVDVREHGSHNAGATNTLRVLGKKVALMVFAVDFFKGFAAASLCSLSNFEAGSDLYFLFKISLIILAVLGHIFPIFAGFRGGKGVATLAGAGTALLPWAVLICLGVFLVVLAISHYVSLSSMIAGATFPIVVYFVFNYQSMPLIVFSIAVSILLIITHRKNIGRLIRKEESKIYLFKRR